MIRGETFTGDGALIVHTERTEEKEDKQCSELRRDSFARSVQPPAGAKEARHHPAYERGVLIMKARWPRSRSRRGRSPSRQPGHSNERR
ncbi:hypothetical protein ACWGQ5_53185 [Streptomyces sp. NPDC055722]